jgi:arsenate reductase-like glutaredoxin family protein
VIVAKGKKVVTFDMKKDAPDDDTLLAHLLGPTGNLRAPTLRMGKTLLVGFSDEAYKDYLGR